MGPTLAVPTRIAHTTGIPDPELLQQHQIVPFAAHYYDAPAMAVLKIAARFRYPPLTRALRALGF